MSKGFFDDVEVKDVKKFERELISYVKNNAILFIDDIQTTKMWTEESETSVLLCIQNFKKEFK